jgi:hypothetical protein
LDQKVLSALTETACASIRFRTREEILGEEPDISNYLQEILRDERVKYVFTWQQGNGYLGVSFHGGLIPMEERKYSGTGAEGALRFLSEMRVPKNHPVVECGLSALLEKNWNPDPWKWSTLYQPESGLFGADHVRAVVFAYFGIEEYDFIQIEIQRTLEHIKRLTDVYSQDDISGTYQNKLYFNQGIALPDLYCLKLLAFTKNWRSRKNSILVAEALARFIDLSPWPQIYIKAGSQLVAPATIFPRDLKKMPRDFRARDWFGWLHTMELFARMGIINEIPILQKQIRELKSLFQKNGGFYPTKPEPRSFTHWSVYTGLALEETWHEKRWKYDLTFRSWLILKLAGQLSLQ